MIRYKIKIFLTTTKAILVRQSVSYIKSGALARRFRPSAASPKTRIAVTVLTSMGLAGCGVITKSGALAPDGPNVQRLEDMVVKMKKRTENCDFYPVAYDIQAIHSFWFNRPFEIVGRGFEILSVLVPYLVKLACWECLIRRKILAHEGLQHKYAIRLREALTKLGPSFVKFGQALAIRPDIMPTAFLFELQKLCDAVPSFPTQEAIRVIEEELGIKVEEIFHDMTEDVAPVAAASLGQVYKLKLKDSTKSGWVAVKVQRPDMMHSILKDIFIMRCLVLVIKNLKELVTRRKAFDVELLDSFAVASLQELDYLNEAANQERFRRELCPRLGGRVYIPQVYHELTTRKVLVTEWIDGEKLASSPKETIKQLIPVGIECFLTQLLDTGYFHADPHPGNLLVTKEGKLALIDFGLCAKIPMPDTRVLTLAIIHIMQGDMSGIIDDAIKLDALPQDIHKPALLKVLQRLYDISTDFHHDDLLELDDHVAQHHHKHFFAVSYELNKIFFAFPFKVPDYFVLLTRAMIVLEGIAMTVNPDFDLFSSAYPFAFKHALHLFGFSDLSKIAADAVKHQIKTLY